MGSALKTQPSSAELDIDPVARHAGASESWWQTVSTAIGRQEYQASRGDDGLQAPNRAQNLRTTFRPDGIEVVPRQGERSDSWRFVWETVRFGRAGAMRTLAPVDPRPNGAQVVYARPGLIEWYENSARGLEQGFAVTKRPAGSGPVVIAGQLGGDLRPELRGDAVELIEAHEAHGASVLRYAELKVFDAKGRDLPAQLALAGAELTIVIDDGGALYPVTVDPLMTSPAWTAESDQEGALFGWSVEPAGDVNGDGFSDVIVGAYDYSNGEALEGRAYVYHGSVAGLSTSPAWTAESNQANAKFGRSVRTAGDVNGDGFSDVIVGAWAYDNGELEEGRAFVYYGSAAGLDASPAWMAEGNQQDANFGLPVSTAGDVNGDGFSDVIVGAINYYEGFDFYEGWAFAYYGSAAGLSPTPSWTAEGNQEGAWFGISATAGDVNADGFSDVIVSALGYDNGEIDEGRVFVYHGSATGLAASPAWITESNQETAASSSVATAGDVNGDGFSDVIFSSTSYDNPEIDEGRVWVYYGSAAGLAASPAWTLESNQAGGRFGSVRTAGDVNGDGFSDIIIGSYTYDNEAGHLRLAVYDVQGRQAALLADEGRRAGTTRCTGMGAIGEGRSSPPGSTSCSSSSAGGWRHERSSSRHRRHRLSLPMLGAFSCY